MLKIIKTNIFRNYILTPSDVRPKLKILPLILSPVRYSRFRHFLNPLLT
jgi:hypothetical protein